MFASLSTTVLTLSTGETVTVRKLSGAEWIVLSRLMTDARTDDLDTARRNGDEADRYAMRAIVAWSADRPIDEAALDDLDVEARRAIVEGVLRHTMPHLFVPPDEAAKNDSGPSTATSETKGQPRTSGD